MDNVNVLIKDYKDVVSVDVLDSLKHIEVLVTDTSIVDYLDSTLDLIL